MAPEPTTNHLNTETTPETTITPNTENITVTPNAEDRSITQNPSIIPDPQKISATPDVSQNTLNLGYLDVQAHPDTQEPPSVIGTINGKTARILLDSGCSTYVLSEEFAVHADIRQYPTTPVAVELAVSRRRSANLENPDERIVDVDRTVRDQKGPIHRAFTPV